MSVVRITDADSPYTVPAVQDPASLNTNLIIVECDTTDGAITVNVGDVNDYQNASIRISDVGDNAGTNNITVSSDQNINGAATDVTIAKDSGSVILDPVAINAWEASNSNLV